MVKVKDDAGMAEAKAVATMPTANTTTNNTTNNNNNNNSSSNNNNSNHNNNSSISNNSIHTHPHVPRKPRNNHNHNHTHHLHQTYHHVTYFHHHCTYPSDTPDTNGATSPAKFYFGPGFEPQNQSPDGGYAPGPSQVQGSSGEYVVLFHVNPGVTINFQYGDTLEVLRGPVTVPMVSTNSSPPIAMPVQVPPGHVVQQIVDESGTLRHVILSPQHPAGLVPLPSHNPQHYAGPANGTSQAQQAFYQGFPPPHFHANIPPGHPVPSPTHLGPSPPPNQTHYKDERTQRQHIKLRKKIQDKQKLDSIMHKELVNVLKRPSAKDKEMNSVGTSEDGEESSIPDEEDSVQIIADILSSVQAPKVSELSSRSALLQWAPPTKLSEASSSENQEIDVSDLRYEVLLSDKSKEMKFKSIYSGASLSCRIQDLRPGQEYSVCLQVHYEELQGAATDPIKFTTPPCEPDQPQPPKLHQRQKNTLHLKWNAVNDNGAYIVSYVLEYDEGKGGDFVEFHKGRVKQHILHKLQPATVYRFRLAAINDVGRSAYSDVVAYSTCSNPPSKPNPPILLEAFVNSLHLQWAGSTQAGRDDDYTLQMNDPKTKYYLSMYHGKETHYLCPRLSNFTEYKFRLRAENDGGPSAWSEEVTYKTLPDRPARPSKPVVKGRIHAHSFKLKWEPPSDTGGAVITEYVLEVNSGSGYETVYSGTETEAVCDKLTPGTTYQLRVSCISQGGASNYSDPCTVTTDAIGPGQCPQPRLHGKPKANAITVRWPEPDYNGGAPVLEYEVEMTSLVDGTRSLVHKSKDIECTVQGLSPGCDYSFNVRAVNRIGPGLWSDPLRVTSGAAPPDAPLPPNAVCKSPFHAFVEWQEPRSNGAPVIEYRLEMSPHEDEEHFHFLYQGPETSHDVKGLSPFTTYFFRVQACNSAGFSPFSLTSATVTPAAPPATITTLRHESTPTSISLSWSEPACNGSPIAHYNIEIGDRLISTDGPVTEYLVEDLQPETNYKVKVQAVNQVGVGSMSPTLRTSTPRLPPLPPRLECIGNGHNYLKLKWGEGKNLDYTQYSVEMENVRSHEFQCVYKGTALTYKVNKLHESTTYKFRVCASNDAGVGDYSDTYEFSTGVAPPATLKQPKLVEVEQRSFVIEWMQGRNTFADPVIYQVQVSRLKEQSFKQVYKGSDNKCSIEDLEPGTEYSARVCPIRLLGTAGGELPGPHSPTLTVTTQSLEPPPVSKVSSMSSSSPSHSHRTQNIMTSLLHTVRLRKIPNTPAFYAFLLMFLGIVMAIGLSFYLTNLNNNNN